MSYRHKPVRNESGNMEIIELINDNGATRCLTIRRVFGLVEGLKGSWEMVLNWTDPATDIATEASGVEILMTFPSQFQARKALGETVDHLEKNGYQEHRSYRYVTKAEIWKA